MAVAQVSIPAASTISSPARGPPPTIFFHFVTASSQIAAVPIQIGWLLGGILLGLEIQALAGQNRSRAPSGCTRGGGG